MNCGRLSGRRCALQLSRSAAQAAWWATLSSASRNVTSRNVALPATLHS